jgi:hypothetical protein
MAEPFIPFVPAKVPVAQVAQAAAQLQVLPPAEASSPPFKAVSAAAHLHSMTAAGLSQPPKITLQRTGEKVTGIRIECTCGQMIELECSY